MQNASTEIGTDDFLRKIDSGLSERRLLEELGKLSCDELAAVLVTWYRDQTKAAHVAD